MIVKGILYFGWIHPRNEEGLKLMQKELNIDVIRIDRDQIDNYQGNWIVLSLSDPCPNIYPGKLIISGPHFYPFNLQSPIIFNALAEWNQNCTKNLPNITRTLSIFFPIDYNKLCPDNTYRDTVILYTKHKNTHDIDNVKKIVHNHTHLYSHFDYNKGYDYDIWLQTLKRGKYGIWFGSSESQGYAVQELMSHDIPLIVIDCKYWSDNHPIDNMCIMFENIIGYKIMTTSVPVWDECCGIKSTIENLLDSMTYMECHHLEYHPRQIIIDKLSPEIIYNQYLKYFHELHCPKFLL